ncbi:hypothetical protein J2848_002270 [Azospirillum lipoferum]|uniref:Uncharacterized protein n=1 Tax=Azospirillum lipoferum TaxID=193 RepID=A0A5A9GSH9_AZOLI|nr:MULTISPECIES: hypothetical protein [Azospirillum]KAA0596594.1 hypothetical protein FZ942_10835 [Azospirillum lipoferum]MCP1610603.1 hypothetical protein [Azospirillum lipoferum]MDW5537954.1 hypothetical protein [Azospirillum sp. NL1]
MSDRNDQNQGQDQGSGQDQAQGDNERMKGVIDQAKDRVAGDLSGHEQDAREGGERIRRAVDAMSTGNTPQAGDDPQHRTGNTGHTPLPDATGGTGASREDQQK